MLTHLVGMLTSGPAGAGAQRLAAVIDVRGREFFRDLAPVLAGLRASGVEYRILFLDASDEVLVRRFEQVRRPHPLQGQGRILDGIAEERAILADLRERADTLIDTSELNVHDLAREVRSVVASGAEDARTRHNDTWVYDGSWRQMSSSAPWSPRDWNATAAYDDKLWSFTGNAPGNSGGLWYSEDGGATWVTVEVWPWLPSHADGVIVTNEDGIVLASGNGQQNFVYTYKKLPPDPSVTMATVAWTMWVSAPGYDGHSTVSGTPSAGTSGTHALEALNTPTFGTTNGRPTIVFDGSDQYLRYDTGGKSTDILDVDGWTVMCVCRVAYSGSNSSEPYQNPAVVASGDANFAVDARSSHALNAYQFASGANQVAGPKAWVPGDLVLVTARFDGTTISIRIGKGEWSNDPSPVPSAIAETFFVGINYNLGQALGWEMCELAVTDAPLSDETLDLCADDMAAKWGVVV
jgi:hypothetical protein